MRQGEVRSLTETWNTTGSFEGGNTSSTSVQSDTSRALCFVAQVHRFPSKVKRRCLHCVLTAREEDCTC